MDKLRQAMEAIEEQQPKEQAERPMWVGKKIKADTYYTLQGGKFGEVEE